MSESSGGGVVRTALKLRDVTAADAGPYTCRATNPHGEHSQVFTVAVIGKTVVLSRGVPGKQVGRSLYLGFRLLFLFWG